MSKNKLSFSIKNSIIGILGIAILTLVFANIKDAFFGTSFQIVTASNGTTLNDNFLPLSGIAHGAIELLINGRSVNMDRKGNFEDAIILSSGYNIVEVALKDRFGKTETKTYQWVVEPASMVAQSGEIIN